MYLLPKARAHSNNEEEGEGRCAKRPRGRLKFQNFPTVVVLLTLDIDDETTYVRTQRACTHTSATACSIFARVVAIDLATPILVAICDEEGKEI